MTGTGFEMGQLDGLVAVVSGAARGQGRSHAIRLAEEGADVIAFDLCGEIDSVAYPMSTRADLDRTVEAVEKLDRRVFARVVDVRDAAATERAVQEGVAELGRLDIVVANAGIVSYYAAQDLPPQAWADMIDTNLTGSWNLAQASLTHLIEGDAGGSIVLVSSSTAHIGMPHVPHYSASKAGLIGLMQSLAVELGPHRIRVNTIHPTGVNTPMLQNEASYELMSGGLTREVNPANPPASVAEPLIALNAIPIKWIEPVDVSNAIVYLTSAQGRFVTGTQLRIDAGSAAK
jgi:SDR family mycofactocin-dependent oxidoreductase